jgi:hypothetical protein
LARDTNIQVILIEYIPKRRTEAQGDLNWPIPITINSLRWCTLMAAETNNRGGIDDAKARAI